jgi:hypothetical protein
MTKKRSQITVKQYHLNNINTDNDKLTITEKGRDIEHFRNFFIQSIENVLDEYIPDNTYFILKFDEMKEDDDEKLAIYEQVLKEGIWLDGVKYIKSVKSPSMVRTQKTLFIRDDIAKKVMEYVSLGKIPTHTVVSKLEAAYGISLSSVLMIESVPNIVFIEDMDKLIKEDIEVVRDCETDPEQIALIDAQIEKDKALKAEWKENRLSDDELKILPFYDWSDFETHKSKNAWYKEKRSIKLEEISKPVGYGKYNDNIYPVYKIEQTEEISFPKCNSATIGKKVNHLENRAVPMTMFDGQALGSFEWFEKASQELGLKYTTNGIQGRLPYFKSLITRFDIKRWCANNGVTEITDLFGDTHSIDDIDILATESCWKTFHDYSTGKKKCLFNSVDEWYKAMGKYGIKTFGVANYAKRESMMKEFTPLNYQFIYALPNLTFEDLKELSKPYEKLLYKVKEGKDVAYIKSFLQMMDSPNDNEYFSDKCLDMLSIDERLIHDKKIQNFLKKRVMDELKNLCRGRIPIRGGYRYLTQDPIAFMEWVRYRDEEKVEGFLDAPYSAYKKGTEGQHLLMRNPTTSPKETVKAQFVKSDNKYVKHLDSIIVTGINDLLLPKFTADVDGDTALYTQEPLLLKGMHDNVPLIHEGDKQFTGGKTDYTEYSLEEIINYEKRNTKSMIGILTNWNTKFQDIALAYGDYLKADLVVSVNKIYQMMLIDAAKTGEEVDIAYPIQMHGRKMKKPYFMYHVYGGKRDNFSSNTDSPINQYVRWIERQKDKIKNLELREIDFDYYQSIGNSMEIFQYRNGLPYHSYLNEVIEKLTPFYKEYTKERKDVNLEIAKFEEQPKIKQDSEERDRIRSKYSTIKQKYKMKCRKIEPNISILATASIELAYRLKDNYDFAWDTAYEGMRYNALQNRIDTKTVLHNLGNIDTKENITGIAEVRYGKMTIRQVELNRRETKILENPIVIRTKLEDGNYVVLSNMGRHYAILEMENKHNEFMCHIWYEKKEDSNIEPVICEKVRMLTRGRCAKEVTSGLIGKEFTLKTVPEKGYANIYDGENMVCSIAPDHIVKRGISMGMDNWKVTFNSVVKPAKEKPKSFTARITVNER